MKMKNTLWLAVAILIASFTSANAQLAGTQRLNENFWFAGDRCLKFGAYPNASICYTGGNLVIDILNGGGKVSFPDGVDLGASNQSLGSSIIFEGATADAFETTVTVTDPTADRTITFPNASGNVSVFDNANTKDVNLIFEGATADAFETTIAVTDPTADRTATVPDASGTFILGGNTTISSGANTACNTTCGASTRCIAGQDTGASGILVACSNAAADVCICSAN